MIKSEVTRLNAVEKDFIDFLRSNPQAVLHASSTLLVESEKSFDFAKNHPDLDFLERDANYKLMVSNELEKLVQATLFV